MMMTHIKYQDLKSLCRNDQLWNQTTRPPHGLINFVRDTLQILGNETQTSQNCESKFLCVQHSYLPIPVQLISNDLSPQCPYVYFSKKFDELMKDYYDVTRLIHSDDDDT